MDGIVKFFNVKRGYGFIKEVVNPNSSYPRTNGKEVFVHFANIKSREHFRKLEQGDRVTFNTTIHPKYKKEQAIDVKVTSHV